MASTLLLRARIFCAPSRPLSSDQSPSATRLPLDFLPLVLLGTETRFPLTVGLSAWSTELNIAGAGQPLYPEAILGSLISVLPMLILFPFLQKYVARGLTFGAVTGE